MWRGALSSYCKLTNYFFWNLHRRWCYSRYGCQNAKIHTAVKQVAEGVSRSCLEQGALLRPSLQWVSRGDIKWRNARIDPTKHGLELKFEQEQARYRPQPIPSCSFCQTCSMDCSQQKTSVLKVSRAATVEAQPTQENRESREQAHMSVKHPHQAPWHSCCRRPLWVIALQLTNSNASDSSAFSSKKSTDKASIGYLCPNKTGWTSRWNLVPELLCMLPIIQLAGNLSGLQTSSLNQPNWTRQINLKSRETRNQSLSSPVRRRSVTAVGGPLLAHLAFPLVPRLLSKN